MAVASIGVVVGLVSTPISPMSQNQPETIVESKIEIKKQEEKKLEKPVKILEKKQIKIEETQELVAPPNTILCNGKYWNPCASGQFYCPSIGDAQCLANNNQPKTINETAGKTNQSNQEQKKISEIIDLINQIKQQEKANYNAVLDSQQRQADCISESLPSDLIGASPQQILSYRKSRCGYGQSTYSPPSYSSPNLNYNIPLPTYSPPSFIQGTYDYDPLSGTTHYQDSSGWSGTSNHDTLTGVSNYNFYNQNSDSQESGSVYYDSLNRTYNFSSGDRGYHDSLTGHDYLNGMDCYRDQLTLTYNCDSF